LAAVCAATSPAPLRAASNVMVIVSRFIFAPWFREARRRPVPPS
jgi:hypothetical protein